MNFHDEFFNVELHTHLDGSFLPKTILQVAKRRNKLIPFKTEEDLNKYLRCDKITTLRQFLEPFAFIVPIFSGDKEAIWQMSYEFIQQCASSKTCYVEVRFCPFILMGSELSCDQVIEIVLEALTLGRSKFFVEFRVIICGLREQTDNMKHLLEIAEHWKPHGVVGIDVAGDEQFSTESGGTHSDLIKMVKQAEKAGIHRTIHAGENGPAESVREAVYEMHAERLGHGYHVLDDPDLYEDIKKKNIHFEVCPSSSFMTGAVSSNSAKHPIIKFYKDNVNYSINTDDTMMTGRLLDAEIEFASSKFDLPQNEIKRITANAAKSCFLDREEKSLLLKHLAKFGIK